MANLISIQINGNANIEVNLAKVAAFIKQACEKDNSGQHKLVVLPECFSIFGVAGSEMFQHAETQGKGSIQQTLSELAVSLCRKFL